MWLWFALAAAVVFGIRGILYHWSAQQPIDRNLVLLGTFAFGTLVCLILGLAFRQSWTGGSLYGLLMGLFTFAANLSVYKAFADGKSSLPALFTALAPVPVLLYAFLVWGETLNIRQWIAFVVIVTGVVLLRYSGRQALQRLQGIKWGLSAMLFFAACDLANKQASLAGGEPFTTLTYMFLVASVIFGIWWRVGRNRRRRPDEEAGGPRSEAAAVSETARKWSETKTFLWGMMIGLVNTTGMVLLFQGFKLGVTGLVTAVISTNVIVILLYARFVVKESFRRTEMGGVVLSMCGVAVLHLFG